MGKAKKNKMARRGGDPILGGGGGKKKVPLDLQLRRDEEVEEGEGVIRPKAGRKGEARDAEEEFLDRKLTRKILDAARDQQEELQEEFGVSTGDLLLWKGVDIRRGLVSKLRWVLKSHLFVVDPRFS